MKGVFVLSFFHFFFFSSFAQNLVPNPGFDCGVDQCYYTINALEYQNFVCKWSCPSPATSDIFSTTVQDISCYGFMPDNGINKEESQVRIGSQLPRSGHRFAGIYTYGPYEYREYLQVKLLDQLVAGQTYCAEVYVSLADYIGYANNNLGMYFHQDSIFEYSSSYLLFQPQIVESEVIKDTTNWVRIIGSFTAEGPYRYLTIGNFSDNTNTIAEKKPSHRGYYDPWGYYFIEDVAVYALPQRSFQFTGNTSVCRGEYTDVYAQAELEDITWSLLSAPSQIINVGKQLRVSPENTTSYLVTGKNCNLIVSDTVTVEVLDVNPVELINDITICEGQSVDLDAGSGYLNYKWQDNSNTRFLKAEAAGVYSVWVEEDNGCKTYDEVIISTEHPPVIDIGDDRMLCDDPLVVEITGEPGDYFWSTGSTASFINVADSGSYWVTAENNCGVTTESVRIYSVKDVFIPNFLSRNGDGLNDKFEVRGIGNSETLQLKIFNRWGEIIYSNNDYHGNWPVQNTGLSSGTYYYSIRISECRELKGWIRVVVD